MSFVTIRDSLLLDRDKLSKIYNKAMRHQNELVHQKANKNLHQKYAVVATDLLCMAMKYYYQLHI